MKQGRSATAARPRTERQILYTTALITTLAPLNSTMITVALPAIRDEFAVSATIATLLIVTYLVTMASLLPISGKLGDRYGRRPLILCGVLYFGLASVGAAVATSLPMLVVFRVQQAIAGALTFPNGAALIREVVPADRRGRSFGAIGAATSLAAASGPAIGGVLIGALGWRSIFAVNLVIIIPALLVGWRSIPASTKAADKKPFDILGACLLLILLVSAASVLIQTRQSGDLRLLVPGAALVAIAGVVFLRRELRHPDPVVQPRLFRVRAFTAANAAVALSNMAMYTTMVMVPMLLTDKAGWPTSRIGLVLTTLAGASVICAPIGGRLSDRFGRRRPVIIGLALGVCGAVVLALSGFDVSLLLLIGGLAIMGVGLGIANPGMQTTAVESVGPREAGTAAGIYSTSRYLGSIVGSSILAALLSKETQNGSSYRGVFILIVVAAAIAVTASLGLRGGQPSSDEDLAIAPTKEQSA